MYPTERVSRKLQMNHVSGNSAFLIIDDSVREHSIPLFILFFCDQVLSELIRNFYSCECAMFFQLLNIYVESELQLNSAIC
jgi:hypothetical protein